MRMIILFSSWFYVYIQDTTILFGKLWDYMFMAIIVGSFTMRLH